MSCPQCTTLHKPKLLTKSLTCCGLQKQQGEETADQDCTLHDGCQENSDSHTDYIYQGRKVKGHAERRGGAQRGPAGGGAGVCVFEVLQESWHATGTLRVEAAGSPFYRGCSLGLDISAPPPGSMFQCWITQFLTDDNFTKCVSEAGNMCFKRIHTFLNWQTGLKSGF